MSIRSRFPRGLVLAGLTLGLALQSSACATAPPPPASHSVTVLTPGPKPHAKAVWVKGHYVYRAGKYNWIPGHWKRTN